MKPIFIDVVCHEFLFSVSNVSMGFCQRRRGGENTLIDPACSNHLNKVEPSHVGGNGGGPSQADFVPHIAR